MKMWAEGKKIDGEDEEEMRVREARENSKRETEGFDKG